ncbi:MAG: replication protein [Gemmataceae bacterium]
MARSLIPNSTQVPDVILDHWMAELSGAEFKVLLYVARRTYGFGKESDKISLSQLAEGIRRRDGRVIDRGTGLSKSGVKAACVTLIEKKLLIRTSNQVADKRESEESTYRLNLFAELPNREDEQADETEVGQNLAYVGQKKHRGRPEIGQEVGQKLAPHETDQETDQETAAATATANEEGDSKSDAAAELILELVKHGVGKRVAEKLARTKPDVCKRCLSYLPYAKIRSTNGAWLAAAIEQEFGPPAAFVEFEKSQKRKTETQTGQGTASITAQDERETVLRKQLVESLEQLPKTQPRAFKAFEKYLKAERRQSERFVHLLNDKNRITEFLASLESEEYRLGQFEEWLKTNRIPTLQKSNPSLNS